MAGVIETAVSWAESIAADNSHVYSQSVRWGPSYDCSSFVISAYRKAGLSLSGASYTGNMYNAFVSEGFKDITNGVNLQTGKGLKRGDVLLNTVHHAAMVEYDGGTTVEARGTAYGIVANVSYRSYPWNYALRYSASGAYSTDDGEEYLYSENASDEASVVWNDRVNEDIQPNIQSASSIEGGNEPKIYANGTDITAYTGDLSWNNSLYELSTEMTFSAAKTDNKYISNLIYNPSVGDVVQMVTNIEVFRGVITSVDDGDEHKNTYTAHDMGWYLNKTSQTYQFKDITATDAIKEICADLSITIDTIPKLTTNINQIYFDKCISDIIKDILDQCGGDYNYDFVPEGMRIYEIGDLTAYPEFRVANNVQQAFSGDYKGDVSHSLSIEDMKNSIKITSEADNVYTELLVLQNRELMDKYGFLQEIVKIDPDEENAETTAKAELAEKGRVAETYSIKIVEKYDSYTRAGEVIELDGAKYVIESTDHSYDGGVHYNSMELKAV